MTENITVEIGGKTLELKPTLRAARVANTVRGGFTAALRGIQDGDMNTIVMVISAGIGKTKPDEINDMEETLFNEGIDKFIGPSVQFIVRLMNGGRDPAAEADKEPPKGK